jgi:uncharacterized protein YqeY
MSLIQHIKDENLKARKQKFTAVVNVLTPLIGEAEMVGKNAGREVTDQEVVTVIKKFIKNLDETIKVLGDNDPRTLIAMGERATLETFLPKQLTEQELADHIHAIHAGLVTHEGKADMGSIMKMLKIRFDGLYDGKLASTLIRKELS